MPSENESEKKPAPPICRTWFPVDTVKPRFTSARKSPPRPCSSELLIILRKTPHVFRLLWPLLKPGVRQGPAPPRHGFHRVKPMVGPGSNVLEQGPKSHRGQPGFANRNINITRAYDYGTRGGEKRPLPLPRLKSPPGPQGVFERNHRTGNRWTTIAIVTRTPA